MILRDNPDEHCFLLRDLVLIELFYIGHTCVTRCMMQAKIFVKTCLKAIRDM